MIDSRHWPEPLDDIEALIRSAQDYVHASDDLRPRVLEAARSQRGQRRALGHLQQAAILLLLLGALATALQSAGGISTSAVLANVGSEELLSAAATDGNWGLVDSFTELRRRQALLFGAVVELPRRKA